MRTCYHICLLSRDQFVLLMCFLEVNVASDHEKSRPVKCISCYQTQTLSSSCNPIPVRDFFLCTNEPSPSLQPQSLWSAFRLS